MTSEPFREPIEKCGIGHFSETLGTKDVKIDRSNPSRRMKCRLRYRVEEHFRAYDNLDEVLDAENDYPLQQFYLVRWRWTYMVQHRREVQAKESLTSPLYKWYRFFALDNYHRGSNRKPFDNLATFLAKSMARLFQARPHWGKLCPISPEELWMLYPAMERFADVRDNAGPDGRFHNPWTERLFCKHTDSITKNRSKIE